MSLFDKHLSDTRQRLMRPSRTVLSDGDLADYVIQVIDGLVIDLNSTGEPWFLQTALVEVTPGMSIYPLTFVPNFSRARYLYTYDEADPDAHRSPLEIVPYETLTEDFGGGDPGSANTWGQSCHSAAAVYYLNEAPGPDNVIEFAPVLDQTVNYKLVYEPDVVRAQHPKDQGFRLQQFAGYVAALTALKAMPHCEWKGLAQPEARKNELRAACLYDIGSINERRGYAWQFWCFAQSSTQIAQPTTIGWAEDRW